MITSAIQGYKNFNKFHSLNQKKLVSNQLLKLLLKKNNLDEVATDACRIIHSQSLKSENSNASIYLTIDKCIELIAHCGHQETPEEICQSKKRLAVLQHEDTRQNESRKNEFRYYKSGSESDPYRSRITIPLKKEGTTFAFLKIKTDYDIVHPSEAHLYYQDIATSLSDVLILAQERIHFDQLNKQNSRLEDILNSFNRMFRKKAHIYTATSSQKALDLIESGEEFAIIVSDMRMPNMDGAEFLAKAKIP